MTALLTMYRDRGRGVKEEVEAGSNMTVTDGDMFLALVQLAVFKYAASMCLGPVYGVMTASKDVSERGERKKRNVLDVKAVLNGDAAVPAELAKWGPLDLSQGLRSRHLGVRPRFDLHRSETVKAQDVRDYEKLLFPKQKLAKMSDDHPIVQTLKLMKIK